MEGTGEGRGFSGTSKEGLLLVPLWGPSCLQPRRLCDVWDIMPQRRQEGKKGKGPPGLSFRPTAESAGE